MSRQLSLFFKCYINEILRKGTADNFGGSGERKAVIVYSGGDDVFLAGAWNDVIAACMDIRNALKRI
ncbi:MAG: Cas10/Cmr2 second palm domain-containing protein [Roseburia sp.]